MKKVLEKSIVVSNAAAILSTIGSQLTIMTAVYISIDIHDRKNYLIIICICELLSLLL